MADQKKSQDAGEAQMQKLADEAEDKGFLGEEVDPTPNERYSLESKNWDTPESSPKEAANVGSSKFSGVKGGDDA
jgi:hypothetical protein